VESQLWEVKRMKPDVVTKCGVLYSTAKIFNPHGLFSPVIYYGKVFLQKLWITDKSWDEPLTNELRMEWHQVAQYLSELSNVKLPRFVGK